MNSNDRFFSKLFSHPFCLVLIGLVYSLGLWRFSIALTGDQKTYIRVALEMMEKGSFWTPYWMDQVHLVKPPFHYWMNLLFWNLFGVSFFTTMLPSLVMMLGSAYYIGKIEKLFHPEKKILWSPWFFAFSAGTFSFATVAQMEMDLVFFIWGAWFYLLRNRPQDEWKAALFVGLLGLVKSPLYCVLFALSYLGYLIWSKKSKEKLSKPSFCGAWFFAVLLSASWYVLMWWTEKDLFLSYYLGKETLEKGSGNNTSFYGIWVSLFVFCLPWIFLFFRKQKYSLSYVKTLLWIISPYAIFFTLYPYRVNTYLYPLVPAVFLLLASAPETPERNQKWMRLSFFLMIMWVGVRFLVTSISLPLAEDVGAFQKKHPHLSLAMMNEEKDVWHEAGYYEVGSGVKIHLLSTPEEAKEWLKNGGALWVTEKQKHFFEGTNFNPQRYEVRRLKKKIHLQKQWKDLADLSLYSRIQSMNLYKTEEIIWTTSETDSSLDHK